MFRSQCPYLGLIGLPTLPADEPGQIGQRSTLADEVVNEVVSLAALNRSIEERLIGQPREAVGSGVSDGIQLHDRIMDG